MPRRITFEVEYCATIMREINDATEMECEVESFDEWKKANPEALDVEDVTADDLRDEYREYLEEAAMAHASNEIEAHIEENNLNQWEESVDSCECDGIELDDDPFIDDPKPKADESMGPLEKADEEAPLDWLGVNAEATAKAEAKAAAKRKRGEPKADEEAK